MAKKRQKQRRIAAKATPKRNGNVNSNHRTSIHKEQDEIAEDKPVTNDSASNVISNLPFPVGLQNLGNTCFFNSVIQNLSHTPLLLQVLKHQQKLANNNATSEISPQQEHIPTLTYKPSRQGKTTSTLINFLESYGLNSTHVAVSTNGRRQAQRTRVISPKPLFNQICAKNARFQSYQQQDSQELLHTLLDAIKMEDIKRHKLGILQAMNLERAMAKDVPEELRGQVKAYGIEVIRTETSAVDLVFGGTILSSVLCDNCGTVTGVKEPFCDISLPIVDDKKTFNHQRSNFNKKAPKQTDANQTENSNTTESPTPSKHAQKRAKKEAKRQNRRAQKILEKQKEFANHENQVNGLEPPGDLSAEHDLNELASGIAKMAISDAISALDLTSNGADQEIKETPKLLGGAGALEERDPDDDQDNLTGPTQDGGSDQSSSSGEELEEGENSSQQTSEKDDTDDDVKKLKPNMPMTPKTNKNAKAESLFDTPQHNHVKSTSRNFCKNLPVTLSPRYQPKDQECSVMSCLHQFTMAEMLTGTNMFGCENCTRIKAEQSGDGKASTVYCSASKQMLINKPPAVLIIHLKRFQQVGFNLRKVNKHVHLSTVLDLSPFCTSNCQPFADDESQILYHLYGIVEHTGSLSRGHYMSYVKVRADGLNLCSQTLAEDDLSPEPGYKTEPPDGLWYHISDTSVTKASESRALACNAYLLFYERLV